MGVNAGWRVSESRWLLVLNPDVEISNGFLGHVLRRLDHYEADPSGVPGIVGFGLRNPDGSPQGSVGAFPSLARSIWEQFLPRSRRKYQPGWRIRPGAVDWVTGACMLVNPELFDEIGGMDEDFFLYHEEVALSRVARARGWRVEYDPSVSVIHRHPLQNRAISPKMRIITRHSKLLYFRKHLPYWQFWSLTAIVAAEAAIRGRWALVQGQQAESRAWRTIAGLARQFRREIPVRGRDVLTLAEWATDPERRMTAEAASPDPEGPRALATGICSTSRIGTDASRGAASRCRPLGNPKGWTRVTTLQHAARIGLLMAGAAALLGWEIRHTEASFADGLRYIHRAEQIDRGSWTEGVFKGIDHPLHPLGIVAAHRVLGGDGPASWERAALALCFACAVLLVIPTYLLARELFSEESAWIACVLVLLNPIISYVVVNILSESTFLLWWTFGLWSGVRFLREGRFLWLPLAIGFGALAYLTRPEGMLLPAAVALTLLLLPILRATRINWPRWWRALAFLGCGSDPARGTLHRRQGGTRHQAGDRPCPGPGPAFGPDGAGARASAVTRPDDGSRPTSWPRSRCSGSFAAMTPPLFAIGLFALGFAAAQRILKRYRSGATNRGSVKDFLRLPHPEEWLGSRIRAWLFLSIVLAASAVALVRLHATGGYCTVRHGLVPGMILTMVAGNGLAWLMLKAAIPGRWLGVDSERLRPGPAVWAVFFVLVIVLPNVRVRVPAKPGPFDVYQSTGRWIAEHAGTTGRVLDLTDWSLFFSQRRGFAFASVYDAPKHPEIRWIVVRKPHVEGRWHYSQVIRQLIGNREPVALIPAHASSDQIQIRIYDRESPPSAEIAKDG